MKYHFVTKNILAFLIVLGLSISLFSCNKHKNTETVNATLASTEEHVIQTEKVDLPQYTSMFSETISPEDVVNPKNSLIQCEGIFQITVKKLDYLVYTYDILRIYNAPYDNEAIAFIVKSFDEISFVDYGKTYTSSWVQYDILYNNGMEVIVRYGDSYLYLNDEYIGYTSTDMYNILANLLKEY